MMKYDVLVKLLSSSRILGNTGAGAFMFREQPVNIHPFVALSVLGEQGWRSGESAHVPPM